MTINLDTLRKTAEAATPGPWIIDSLESGEHGVFVEESNPDYRKLGCASAIVASHLVGKNAEYLEAFDPDTVLTLLSRLEQAEQQRDSSREACKTLAEVLSNHSEWIVEATDSQDLIGEDGDGDWDVVWDRVMELGEAKRKAEQAVARVRAIREGDVCSGCLDVIDEALDGDGRG